MQLIPADFPNYSILQVKKFATTFAPRASGNTGGNPAFKGNSMCIMSMVHVPLIAQHAQDVMVNDMQAALYIRCLRLKHGWGLWYAFLFLRLLLDLTMSQQRMHTQHIWLRFRCSMLLEIHCDCVAGWRVPVV